MNAKPAQSVAFWPQRSERPEVVEPCRLPPVELDDASLRHPPGGEVGAHAERHDEGRLPEADRADGRLVEVVVVIVRDDHRVHGRHLVERQERSVEAPGPHPRDRRGPLTPDRIDQHAAPILLDEEGGVTEPGDAQPGLRRGDEALRVRRLHGDVLLRSPVVAPPEGDVAQRAPQVVVERLRVLESPILPLRRALHPGAPRALRAGAERGTAGDGTSCDGECHESSRPGPSTHHAAAGASPNATPVSLALSSQSHAAVDGSCALAEMRAGAGGPRSSKRPRGPQ